MKLEITFWNQIKALFDIIFISCLYFGFWFLNLEILNLKFIIYLAIPFIVIFVVPVIIIHLNYYLSGIKKVYEIDRENVLIIRGNKRTRYNIEDISEVLIYMTPNKLKDSAVRSLPFENYYYIRLQFTDGQNTILTSLYSNKIDKIIQDNVKHVKIIKVGTFYPLIK